MRRDLSRESREDMAEDMVDIARSESIKDLVKGSKTASLLELDNVAVRD